MSFRGNQNRSRNYGSANFGAPIGGNRMGGMSPWEGQNTGPQFGNNMRQGAGGGLNNVNLVNNFLNLLRNQTPPSLLDLPRGGIGGNRNQRGGPMMNRSNIGGPGGNRHNSRRSGGGGGGGGAGGGGQGGQGFQNRSLSAGSNKSAQKQGTGGGIRKQNSFERAKKVLAKNTNNQKKKENANAASSPAEKKAVESPTKESPYASVPNDMFYCHLCKKHMWDANSFENHIKGRTHLMMREGIEESYRLKANMIRQEAKIAEQLKAIELDRLKRMGKSKQRQLDYCTMCDLNFHGHISTHRKSDGHLRLKKFLHPRCVECNREFATRIDYDSHLLAAEHLIIAAKKNTKVGEQKRQTLPIISEEEEQRDVRPPQKKRKQATKAADKEGADDTIEGEAGGEGGADATGEKCEGEAGEGAEAKEAGEGDATEAAADADAKEGEEAGDEEPELPADPEDVILDFQDGDSIPPEIESRLPKYNWTRPVGAGLIAKIECYECSVCGKFLENEKTVEVHTRTQSHHRNFLKLLNEKANDTKIAQKRAAAALEESERKKRKLEEAAAVENGPKKTKIADDNAAEENWEATDGQTEDDKEGATTDLYDPSEATGEGDDEDAEMADNGESAVDAEEEESKEANEIDNAETEVATEDNSCEAVEEPVKDLEQVEVQAPNEQQPTESVATAETPKPAEKQPVAAATPNPPTPTKTTPTAAPKAAVTTPTEATPAKRPAQPRNTAVRGTPRGRGRGRYNRY